QGPMRLESDYRIGKLVVREGRAIERIVQLVIAVRTDPADERTVLAGTQRGKITPAHRGARKFELIRNGERAAEAAVVEKEKRLVALDRPADIAAILI